MTAARTIAFNLNGTHVTAVVQPHHTLIEVLQAQFSLTGARESCGQGLCGCCTVVINDHPVSGCLYLAAFVDGAKVTTIEGLETANELSPVQQALSRPAPFSAAIARPASS
jgi:carbon-monoxide dehydrogenase small subunit